MKNVKLFSFILGFFSLIVLGQEQKHFFKQEYFPNSEYLMETKMQMDGKMSFDDSLVQKMPKDTPREIEMSMNLENNRHFFIEGLQNGTIPFEYDFFLTKSLMIINGKEVSASLPEKAIKVKGQIRDGNKIEIKDVEGKEINESVKKMMAERSYQARNYIDFPKEGLVIGERFTQAIPYNVNIPGMGDMEMKMEVVYTLKEIRNNTGVFLVDAKMDTNIDVNNMNIVMLGKGEMLFDRDVNQFSYFDLELDIDMKMDMAGQGNILYKSKAKTITTMKKTK